MAASTASPRMRHLNRPGFPGGSPGRILPEVRAVRMVFTHAQDHASQWAAITSIAEKIGR